jgi:lipopolysaccharide export system protein LptC
MKWFSALNRQALLACLVGCALVPFARGQMPAKQVVEKFRVPEFDANGVKKSEIFGDRAELSADAPIQITGLKLYLYKEGVVDATITASQCIYDRKEKLAFSNGDVSIERGKMRITGKGFRWLAADQHITILNDVRVLLQGMPVWTKKEKQ